MTINRARQNAIRNAAQGRWRKESRLAMAAFMTFAVICIGWMLPWAPSGLSPQDYSPQLLISIFLLAGSAATGILTFALRDLARRDLDRVTALGEFYDEATGMNNRFFLLDRLAARIDRAHRRSDSFALFILRFTALDATTREPIALSGGMLQEVGQGITKLLRRGDVVATLGTSEFAIVADDVLSEEQQQIISRLEQSLLRSIADQLDTVAEVVVTTGKACFPKDGDQPDALIAAARGTALMLDAA